MDNLDTKKYKKIKFAIGFLIFSLILGTLGYKYIANLKWINAFTNSSNILSGMGPVDRMLTNEAKLFQSFYALYSGAFFLIFFAIIVDEVILNRLTK